MIASVNRYEVKEPFLTKYAAARIASPDVPGYYSSQHEMWVVNVDGMEEPLIEKHISISEIVTKTMTQREADDQPNMVELSCFLTKTNAIQKQDDRSFFSVLDIATKTESQLERDDVGSDFIGLFF